MNIAMLKSITLTFNESIHRYRTLIIFTLIARSFLILITWLSYSMGSVHSYISTGYEYACVAGTGRHYCTLSGLIRLVISLECLLKSLQI